MIKAYTIAILITTLQYKYSTVSKSSNSGVRYTEYRQPGWSEKFFSDARYTEQRRPGRRTCAEG